ncbi:MAG TPA: hypothetical protein VFO38_01850, partial [Candidatus Saccharimonadales bacterium]|nr:hypothetical protein [Candidatus Saccharimonadales bacterium]
MLQTRTDYGKSFAADLWGSSRIRRWVLASVLAVIAIVWWRINVGILEGRSPLLSWMVLAETACVIMLILATQQLAKLAATHTEAISDAAGLSAARSKTASLIVQFSLIIAGNTLAVVLIFAEDLKWLSADWLNVIVAAACMSPLVVFEVLRRINASWRWLKAMGPFLEALRWSKPWAKCWYVLALKAFPQATQTVVVFSGAGRVDIWGVVFLCLLGAFRLYEAWGVRKVDKKSPVARALLVSTVADFVTMSALFVVVLARMG